MALYGPLGYLIDLWYIAEENDRRQLEIETSLVDSLVSKGTPYDINDYMFGNQGLKIDKNKVIVPTSLEEEVNMTHDEYVVYLLNKYGQPKCDYFTTEHSFVKNTKIERLDDGLHLHHLAEECRIALSYMSEREFAKTKPFSLYRANNFIYCNYLEHLMLHIKIALEDVNEPQTTGVDLLGAIAIWRELNQYFGTGKVIAKNKIAAELIKDRYDDYITILCSVKQPDSPLAKYVTLEELAENNMGIVVQKIYEDVKNKLG